jgi:hypothetical protein
MAKLNWSMTMQVSGGPTISAGQPDFDVEAVDRIEVTINAGDTDKVVKIQPGAAGNIHLLAIASDSYGPKLSFKAGDSTNDSPKVVLDTPQLYASGAVALFTVAPQQLKFTNGGTDPANVLIFVARDAKV